RFADQPSEFDDHGFGPETAVAFAAGRDEADVAAVIGRNQGDIGIGGDLFALEWREGNERIVFGVDDQRWHGDVGDERQGAGAFIIVRNVTEAHVRRGDEIIELANRPDAAQPRRVIAVG